MSVWRKSSYSSTGGANCVEVGNETGRVLVRDTKQADMGTVLTVSPSAWRSFTDTVRREHAIR